MNEYPIYRLLPFVESDIKQDMQLQEALVDDSMAISIRLILSVGGDAWLTRTVPIAHYQFHLTVPHDIRGHLQYSLHPRCT